jgi:hypothetical protein
VSVLTRRSQRGFILRFAILALLLLVAPALAHLVTGNAASLKLAPAVVAAAIVVIGFIWWRVEALLAFALFVLFYDTLALYMSAPVRRFDEMAVPGLALVAAWSALPRIREWWSWPRELALAFVVVIGVASSLVNHVAFFTWGIQLVLLVKAIVIFYVARWTSARTFQIAGAMKVVLGIGLLVMALGVVEVFNPLWFQRTLHLQQFITARGPLFAVKSLFFHPVLYSWFTAFIAIYAWMWYLDSRRRLAWAIAALFSFGPFLGERRRAILALLTALAVGFITTIVRLPESWRGTVRRWMPVGATMIVILVLFIPLLLNLWTRTTVGYLDLPTPGTSSSAAPVVNEEGEAPPQVRIALYNGSVEIAQDYFPLGAGLGRWASWMSREDYSELYYEYQDAYRIHGLRPLRPVNVTDTFWPQIIGELGFLGTAAYLVFLGSVAYGLWRAAGRFRHGVLRVFAFGSLLILAQALIESVASPMFHSPPRAYLLYVALGVATAIGSRAPDDWVEPDAADAPAGSAPAGESPAASA